MSSGDGFCAKPDYLTTSQISFTVTFCFRHNYLCHWTLSQPHFLFTNFFHYHSFIFFPKNLWMFWLRSDLWTCLLRINLGRLVYFNFKFFTMTWINRCQHQEHYKKYLLTLFYEFKEKTDNESSFLKNSYSVSLTHANWRTDGGG